MNQIIDAPESAHALVTPRTPDEDLAAACRQVEAVLTMARDMARDGAVLRMTRPISVAPTADVKDLWRCAISRLVGEILDHAVIVEPEGQ